MEKINISDGFLIHNNETASELYELIGLTAPIRNYNYSLALTKLPNNSIVARHKHVKSEELYIITKGSATMIVNNSKIKVSEGDTIIIYANDVHEMYTSTTETIEFYALTIPPFETKDFIIV